MEWFKQSQDMMRLWADTQQQIMNSWVSMAQPANAAETAQNNFAQFTDWWRDMAMQNIRAMTTATDSTTRTVAEKMYSSQMAMMQLLDVSAKVWQNVAPVVESNGDWQSTLQAQMDMVRDRLMAGTTDVVKSAQSMNQLWQTYLKEWQSYAGPWMQAMQSSMGQMGPAMTGDRSALTEMTGLYWDAYEETFGKLLRAPGLGYTREMDEHVRHAFAAWLDFQQAGYEYQVILGDAWVHALEQLMHELIELSQHGEATDGVRDFLNRWSMIADKVFKGVFESDAYVKSQGKLVNSMMEYRRRQRVVNEMVLEMNDLPTRSEVDEAHRRIYELRKEVKALKRELAEMKTKKPARRSTRKKKTTSAKKEE